jgi:hypothetical protein
LVRDKLMKIVASYLMNFEEGEMLLFNEPIEFMLCGITAYMDGEELVVTL